MKFLGELYVSCRSMSSELLVMVIRFKSGAAWPGSSGAPRFTESTGVFKVGAYSSKSASFGIWSTYYK